MNALAITKIFIADDHKILRDGVCALIKKYSSMEVVGQSGDGITAIEQICKIQPDIIILDINLPGMDGIEVTKELIKDNPRHKIISLSAHSEKNIVEQILKAGAVGFVHKESAFDELITAIETVIRGKTYLCCKVRNVLINNYIDGLRNARTDEATNLNEKEFEIVRHISLGKSSKEIALEMEISPKTVDAYRREIMKKLGLNSVADLIKFAIREGITIV